MEGESSPCFDCSPRRLHDGVRTRAPERTVPAFEAHALPPSKNFAVILESGRQAKPPPSREGVGFIRLRRRKYIKTTRSRMESSWRDGVFGGSLYIRLRCR